MSTPPSISTHTTTPTPDLGAIVHASIKRKEDADQALAELSSKAKIHEVDDLSTLTQIDLDEALKLIHPTFAGKLREPLKQYIKLAPPQAPQPGPSSDLQSVTKLLKQVCYRLVEEKQLKLDVWLSENRTQAEQKEFRDNVIDYYGRRGDNGHVRCMVTGLMLPGNLVTAGHIYKSATRGAGLSSFGLAAADIHAARNGFVIATEIERHFDIKDLCFIYDPFRKCYVVHILNPDIHSKIVVQQICFSDLQGLTVFSEPKTPYRRLLNFHSKCAVTAAKDNGWVHDEEYVLSMVDLSDTQSDDEDDFMSKDLRTTYIPSTQLSIAYPIIASKFKKQDHVEHVVTKKRARVKKIVRRGGKVYCTVRYNNGKSEDIDQDNLNIV